MEKHLDIETEDNLSMIKKCNCYACIISESLRFLDIIISYVAPGINYALFLKAYGVAQQKLFFPYEYLDCEEKLEDDCLPPYDYDKNVLDENGDEKSGQENYDKLQRLWARSNMESLRDFLVNYNNQEVGP